MNLNDKNILNFYLPIMDFLSEILGPNCEIVLHNVENVNESIVAIKNSYISDRSVNGPMTDLALKLIKDKAYEEKPYLLNYSSKTANGKALRSSTLFIKNAKGKLIGMLCFNMDVSMALSAKKFIDSYIENFGGLKISENDVPKHEDEIKEHFQPSIEDMIHSIIENTILNVDIPPERLSPEEKLTIVQKLNEKGVFLLKGSISEVARLFKVSENTIYRYINKRD